MVLIVIKIVLNVGSFREREREREICLEILIRVVFFDIDLI